MKDGMVNKLTQTSFLRSYVKAVHNDKAPYITSDIYTKIKYK